jgi:hypothetical protein
MIRSDRSHCFDPAVPVFYISVDLGQSRDFTAVAVVRRIGNPAYYQVKDLHRFSRGTSYPEIVEKIKSVVKHPYFEPNLLVVDGTGVGAPVVDLFKRDGLHLIPIIIHGGDQITYDKTIRVPKRDLVGVLQVLLQTKRLKIAAVLPDVGTFVEELSNFQVRISDVGHDSYGVWREGVHDDLVLAVAMACWAAEKNFLPRGLHLPRPRSNRDNLYKDRTINITTHLFGAKR